MPSTFPPPDALLFGLGVLLLQTVLFTGGDIFGDTSLEIARAALPFVGARSQKRRKRLRSKGSNRHKKNEELFHVISSKCWFELFFLDRHLHLLVALESSHHSSPGFGRQLSRNGVCLKPEADMPEADMRPGVQHMYQLPGTTHTHTRQLQ